MKVLVLDDDTTRRSRLFNFWLNVANKGDEEKFDFHWLTTSSRFLETVIANKDITHISLDHDLGIADVSRELSKWMMTRPEDFDLAFKNKIVVIHSMNPPGAQSIADKLYGLCASVQIIPFCQMGT